MTDQTAIEQAAGRLIRALEALDAVVEQSLEAERGRARLADQVHALETDRARLAADLDNQTARARRLESANRDIAERLDAAMGNIRSVLEAQG